MAKKNETAPVASTPVERPRPPAFDPNYRPVDPIYGLPVGLATRKTIVLIVEATRSNPNGDPDSGGAPRQDYYGHGIISSQSVKRVVRDEVARNGLKLYVERDSDLGAVQARYSGDGTKLLADLWDARVLGGVLTACDRKPKGCIQTSGLRSVLPMEVETMGLTRVASHGADPGEKKANMGRTTLVPYTLYVGVLHFDPHAAALTGVSEEDLGWLYTGLIEGWSNNRSAARPNVNLRRMVVFDHSATRGSEQPHITAERVIVNPRVEDPSRFADYEVLVNDNVPSGMMLHVWRDDAHLMAAAAK